MKSGPNIARIAALIGEPARANMLAALMSGMALTARELAHEAGVQPSTASSHLDALKAAKLIALEKQGRHHYFRIANEETAHLIETLSVVAESNGHRRLRVGPKEPAKHAAATTISPANLACAPTTASARKAHSRSTPAY